MRGDQWHRIAEAARRWQQLETSPPEIVEKLAVHLSTQDPDGKPWAAMIPSHQDFWRGEAKKLIELITKSDA
jgi:hypothetical protein